MKEKEIKSMNKIMDSSEKFLGIEKLTERWKIIFKEFLGRTRSASERKEILSGKYPIALADSHSSKAILIF